MRLHFYALRLCLLMESTKGKGKNIKKKGMIFLYLNFPEV